MNSHDFTHLCERLSIGTLIIIREDLIDTTTKKPGSLRLINIINEVIKSRRDALTE